MACAGRRSAEPRPLRGRRTPRRRATDLSLIGLTLLTVYAAASLGCGKYGPPHRSPPAAIAGAAGGAASEARAEAEAAEREREAERAAEQGEK